MLERLISLVKEQSDIPNSGLINLKTNLLNDLGLSSMDKVNLIVAIESEFDVEIPEQKSETCYYLNLCPASLMSQTSNSKPLNYCLSLYSIQF